MTANTQRDQPIEEQLEEGGPFTLPGFFEALSSGTLYGSKCNNCGAHHVPPRPACYECGSTDVTLEQQPREGTIISYTEVRNPPPPLKNQAPYTVAVVELKTGARLTGKVTSTYDQTDIGMSVDLAVREPTEAELSMAREHEKDWPIHVFQPHG